VARAARVFFSVQPGCRFELRLYRSGRGALVVIELLIGGTRLLFSLPSYSLLALTFDLEPLFVPPAADCREYLLPDGDRHLLRYVILRCLFSPVEYLARSDLYIVLGALMVYLLFALILTMPKYRFIFVMTLLVIGWCTSRSGGINISGASGSRFSTGCKKPITDCGRRDFTSAPTTWRAIWR
jgi:hypothetical protein